MFLYPEPVSLDTKPLKGKLYAFRFTWKATEDITMRNVREGFDALFAWFENVYGVRISFTLGIEGELGTEVAFKAERDLDDTLGDLWNFLDTGASDYYLDLTFNEAVLYKPRTPWWVWLVLAGIGGTTIYAFKKGE